MKRTAMLAILLILALGWAAGFTVPASAQSPGLAMNVTSAFNGNFKYGEWLPVQVELANQGSDVDAEVRVQVSSSQGITVFTAPVSLPSGSRKRVTVYVLPNNFSRSLDVRLVDSQGETLLAASVTVRPQPNISYMAGLFAPERGALALINGVKFPGQERPKVISDLTLADLPEKAEALRSFDLLVFNDFDTAQMTPEQAAALAGWVQQGGQLVIGGGAGAQRTTAGLPQALLPARITGTREVSLDDLRPLAGFAGTPFLSGTDLSGGRFLAAQFELAGGQVLVGDPPSSSSAALLVTHSFGGGQVHFSALDLAGVPFNGWPGTQSFWEALIGPAGRYPENMPFDLSPRQYRANSLFYALSNIPSLDLPSIKGISILLGIYILVIGPLNYFFLRWRQRMHLAWVTIPVLTALFAAGSFAIGYTMRGNDLVLNKIALIQAQPDSSGGRADAAVTSYMGLFSPRQQSYEVIVDGQGLVSPMSSYDTGGWGTGVTTGGQMIFEQGQPARVKGLTVNQWAMQSFMSEGTWQDFGGLDGDLHLENEVLKGTIRNDTSYPLTDVVVTMQNRFTRLGDMAPGETRTVDLGLSSLQNDQFGPPLSYRIYQENATGIMTREAELKSNIVSSVFENAPWASAMSSKFAPSSLNSLGGVVVLAWLNQAPPEVSVTGSSLSQQTTALVYMSLDYDLPESGLLSLPAGLMPGGITKMPREGGTCGGTNSVHMGRGEAEFEFKVPENLQGSIQVNTLKVAIWRDSGNQWGMPAIELYNWSTETWTVIQEPIQGTNVIRDAEPYVSEQGLVRLRITSEQDTFGCIYIDLGLEAERLAGQGG